MKIKYDKKKYHLKKTQTHPDEFQFNLIPKRRTCKLCGKGFESNGQEFLTWTDDNGFLRSGYFCRKDLVKVNQVLKEIKYRKI
jgi:hypothetical protein